MGGAWQNDRLTSEVQHASRLGVVPDLDESLHAATLRAEQKMSPKYDAPLENALKKIDESAFDELLVKLLEKWKPADPVN